VATEGGGETVTKLAGEAAGSTTVVQQEGVTEDGDARKRFVLDDACKTHEASGRTLLTKTETTDKDAKDTAVKVCVAAAVEADTADGSAKAEASGATTTVEKHKGEPTESRVTTTETPRA
jgi:hypothetical protein